ncbi:hypothetical protein DEJ15_04390 [Curtobacterium sp. MCJR17_043]|nr:hypothetical protein [Curtobacterium sp. MCJR17_043]WIB36397.1 hypothetical protein DEJ15_04390 [Curtobacterium sp. MCJR17_043]
MLFRDVAEGIHRLELAHTNTYLVETGDRLLVVDAGLPAVWPHLQLAVHDLGYAPRPGGGPAAHARALRPRRHGRPDAPRLGHPPCTSTRATGTSLRTRTRTGRR